MSTNGYIVNPPHVIVYDPISNTARHVYCVLGDVPRAIQHAVESESKPNMPLLREFYGNDYKHKLCFDALDAKGTQYPNYDISWTRVIKGDGDIVKNPKDKDSNGAVDYSDIAELLRGKPAATVAIQQTGPKAVIIEPGVTYNANVHIYAEDKFMELKEKIYMITGIPVYRQHLFYIDNGAYRTTYQLYAEGASYLVDIRNLGANSPKITKMFGIPIDKELYDLREELRIEARDTFMVLADKLPYGRPVYVVDLAQFTAPIHAQLQQNMGDTYQFELFYYGFVCKYFPMLTKEVFYDYVRNEAELEFKYPELARNVHTLEQIHRSEKEIIDYNYRHGEQIKHWAEHSDISIAITQMVAIVNTSRVQINIRNLFDKLRVSRCIPEINAYIDHNNKRYLLRKRFVKNGSDIQFPSGKLMQNGVTLAISLRKQDQDSYHAKNAMSTMDNEQSRYMFLNIWQNGKYYIRTVWNEEDEYVFDDVMDVMKAFVDPIIDAINNLGRYVFVNGVELQKITKTNVTYQGLNVCVFWKRVMLDAAFKQVKALWDPYMRARIIGPRNVKQFERFEFLFRKGMYDFDPNLIERIITASNNIIMSNFYAYLSNAAIKQKWDQNYEGRIVQMTHKTTSVRFEVTDIKEHEFILFHNYILAFIYKAAHNDEVKHSMNVISARPQVKKLRKLKEQDPELFNLKKHGSKKVYSVLCQNERQPLIYTPDEISQMSAAELKKLTQYWNFTLNKPAYYGCPNRAYPHLSFTIDAHPKHYCLPCCSKELSNEESKKNRLVNVCLAKHKHQLDVGAAPIDMSKHIMSYGKDIDIGRLSKLTPMIKSLLSTYSDDFYLFGVPQHVPGIQHCGIVYAIAEALSLSLSEFIGQIIASIKKSPGIFNVLINGSMMEYWHSLDDFIDTLRELFISNKIIGREYHKFKQWSELIIELCHVLLHVSTFIFTDVDGTGTSIDLVLPSMIKSEIIYLSKLSKIESEHTRIGGKIDQIAAIDSTMQDNISPSQIDMIVDSISHNRDYLMAAGAAPIMMQVTQKSPLTTIHDSAATAMADQKYILVVKRQNRYYPIFKLSPDKYFKGGIVDDKWFRYGSNIANLIFNIVNYDENTKNKNIGRIYNLGLMKEFVADNPEYKIALKYINRQNLCYALCLDIEGKNGDGAKLYIPIDYSVHISDGIPITFVAYTRGQYEVRLQTLQKFIDKFNEFINAKYKLSEGVYVYMPIKISACARVNTHGDYALVDGSFYYYFSDASAPSVTAIANYDYRDINALIMKRAPVLSDARTERLGESLYDNYIYQLFVIEFINYIDRERNKALRDKIVKFITNTDFRRNINKFDEYINIVTGFAEDPQDKKLLYNQMRRFAYYQFNKPEILNDINTTIYEFDKITIGRIRGLKDRAEIVKIIREISSRFCVERQFDTKGIRFPNIYLPCEDIVGEERKESVKQDKNSATGYCDGRKLIVNRPLDDLIDILASDLLDDLRSKYLSAALFADNIINYLNFAKYPSELINIYKIME